MHRPSSECTGTTSSNPTRTHPISHTSFKLIRISPSFLYSSTLVLQYLLGPVLDISSPWPTIPRLSHKTASLTWGVSPRLRPFALFDDIKKLHLFVVLLPFSHPLILYKPAKSPRTFSPFGTTLRNSIISSSPAPSSYFTTDYTYRGWHFEISFKHYHHTLPILSPY